MNDLYFISVLKMSPLFRTMLIIKFTQTQTGRYDKRDFINNINKNGKKVSSMTKIDVM